MQFRLETIERDRTSTYCLIKKFWTSRSRSQDQWSSRNL